MGAKVKAGFELSNFMPASDLQRFSMLHSKNPGTFEPHFCRETG
jgi:hypothetical protein